MSANPYSPPTTNGVADLIPAGPSRIGNGPSVVIALGGLCGLLLGLPLMQRQNPVGLLIAVAGWLIGGLAFRQISAKWPHDPFVRRRQILVAVAAVVLPPFALAGVVGTQYPHLIFLAELLGLSVVTGVFASGTRRFRAPRETAESVDVSESPPLVTSRPQQQNGDDR